MQCGIGEKIDKQINSSEKSPEIDPHKHSQLIFDKEAKAIQWSKDSHFYNSAETTAHASCQKMNLKWITYLNVK